MKKTRLRSYARLLAVVGVHIEAGQEVVVNAGLDQPEFVRMLVEECYRAGASKVSVEWSDQAVDKLGYRHRTLRSLKTVEAWELEKARHFAETLPCRIHLLSEDPDGLRGVSGEKVSKARQSRQTALKPYRDQMEGKYQWCVAAVPGEAWARKMFPGLRTSTAVERLWEAILDASRVDGDPAAAWDAHNRALEQRCAQLNALGLTALHYVSPNGTDLRVEMIPEAEWKGGGETSLTGRFFNPNIPSEEVFITPMRGRAEGVVRSTKPLNVSGQLVEDFSIRFEGGRAVEVHAARNEDVLRRLIAMDEGAACLGECALVPEDSPIARSGLLYYNTLFDENAACHLALGMGYIDTLRDYGSYTLEQCRALGVNDSMIHEDFMIGCGTLSIDGIDGSGREIPLFRNGNWAF